MATCTLMMASRETGKVQVYIMENTIKSQWDIVHECDLEDGTPTEWVLKVSDRKFYWIDEVSDGTFDIIDNDARTVLMNCKTLASAKRWVTINLL